MITPTDDRVEQRISEVLSGLNAFAPPPGREPARRPRPLRSIAVAAGCAAALLLAVGAVVVRQRHPEQAGPAARAVGSLPEQIRRLPELRPGMLSGVLQHGAAPCSLVALDVATLVERAASPRVCTLPWLDLGVTPLAPDAPRPDRAQLVDLSGRPLASVPVPAGWGMIDMTRDGIVLCDESLRHGIIRRYGGGDVRLPSCPVAPDGEGGVLFASADYRSVVDAAGRMRAHWREPSVPRFVLAIDDHLLAVGPQLYREGGLVGTFEPPMGQVVGASADGRVVLVAQGTSTQLTVYRDGVGHELPLALPMTGGVVAPDGRHVIIQTDASLLVILDAATLRPVARLTLRQPGNVVTWR
jgi:hypothetical protein